MKKEKNVLTKSFLQFNYIDNSLSISDIARLTNNNWYTIRNHLLKHNIPLRSKSDSRNLWQEKITTNINKLTKEQLEELYINQRLSGKEISELFNVSKATAHRRLKKYNIEIRSTQSARDLRCEKELSVNISFFHKMSPEFAYILGLWASDGCVSNNNKIELSLIDEDVINWVAREIGYTNKVTVAHSKNSSRKRMYRIRFSSIEISQILKHYGIFENKTHNLPFAQNIPNIYLPHYIRGVFDGDGTLTHTYRNGRRASYNCGIVSASEIFIKGFEEYINKTLGTSRFSNKKKDSELYYYYYLSSLFDIMNFADFMYGSTDSFFGMKRKKDKFKDIGWLSENRVSKYKERKTLASEILTENLLKELYINNSLSVKKIAERLNFSVNTIFKFMDIHDIQRRNNKKDIS